MDKRKITLTVIAVAVLLVVLVGSTYAYWALGTNTGESRQATVQTGGLILRLDDTEGSITTNDVIDPNNLSFSKYFSITNESAADGYAKVLFKGLTNTFVTDALVYDLEEVQSDKTSFATPRMIITNEVVPKVSNANATLADGLLIEKGTLSGNTVTPNTKYYKITVRYKYSDTVDQSEDLNKTLVSGFTIEEGQMSVTETVTFDSKGGLTTPTSISATMGSTYGTLPTVKKTRYVFDGWYTDELYTEKVENDSKVLKGDSHTLYAKWVETELPEGYTQLDYLESTGVQYIDTNYLANINSEFLVKFSTIFTGNCAVFGSSNGLNYYDGEISWHWNNNAFDIVYPTSNTESKYISTIESNIYPSLISNNIYIVKYSSNGSTINGTSINTPLWYNQYQGTKTIYLFGTNRNKNTTLANNLKIMYFIINDNKNKIAEFIPAKRETDGKIGMYDVVRNRFFTNLGTGADFTPGEELW